MHRIGIGRGMDGHGRDAELATGPQHPKGNLPAIGYQDLVEHHSMIKRLVIFDRLRIGHDDLLDPAGLGAGIGFIVFIASMIRSVCPCFTSWPTSTKAWAPGPVPDRRCRPSAI